MITQINFSVHLKINSYLVDLEINSYLPKFVMVQIVIGTNLCFCTQITDGLKERKKEQLILLIFHVGHWYLNCKSLDAKCFTITAELQHILKEAFRVAIIRICYPWSDHILLLDRVQYLAGQYSHIAWSIIWPFANHRL